MLLGALDASLSGNLFTGKVVPAGDGAIWAGKGTIRGQDFECCLILWLILKYKDIIS